MKAFGAIRGSQIALIGAVSLFGVPHTCARLGCSSMSLELDSTSYPEFLANIVSVYVLGKHAVDGALHDGLTLQTCRWLLPSVLCWDGKWRRCW
jgi:hypothetical protein